MTLQTPIWRQLQKLVNFRGNWHLSNEATSSEATLVFFTPKRKTLPVPLISYSWSVTLDKLLPFIGLFMTPVTRVCNSASHWLSHCSCLVCRQKSLTAHQCPQWRVTEWLQVLIYSWEKILSRLWTISFSPSCRFCVLFEGKIYDLLDSTKHLVLWISHYDA